MSTIDPNTERCNCCNKPIDHWQCFWDILDTLKADASERDQGLTRLLDDLAKPETWGEQDKSMKTTPLTFNKELALEWIAELRSNHWIPLRERLADHGNKRCCLGVAGEVLISHGLARWEKNYDNRTLVGADPLDSSWAMLPSFACPIFDLPPHSTDNHQGLLAELQDNGATFEQIASVLEKYYNGEGTLRSLCEGES